MGNKPSQEQMTKTVNEALMEITSRYMMNNTTHSVTTVDNAQFIDFSGADFTGCKEVRVNQQLDTKITQITELTSEMTLDLRDAINTQLDNKVDEKLNKDSGIMTMFAQHTKQTSELENIMKTSVEKSIEMNKVNNIIKKNVITQAIQASGMTTGKVAERLCNFTQEMYVNLVVIDIVNDTMKVMSQEQYISKLTSHKKLRMFNGMGLSQAIVLIVASIASVLCMFFGLLIMKQMKSK